MSETVLPLPKRVLMVIAGFAVVVLFVALVFTVIMAIQHQSRDTALKAAAERALPSLTLSGKGYDSEPSFYRLYQRFVYDELHALVTKAAKTFTDGNWGQVLVVDTRSAPPQSVLLTDPGHPAVPLGGTTVSAVLQTGKPAFMSGTVNGESVRAYLAPVHLPSIFDGQDVTAILEMVHRA
jgi:hypothetical protein